MHLYLHLCLHMNFLYLSPLVCPSVYLSSDLSSLLSKIIHYLVPKYNWGALYAWSPGFKEVFLFRRLIFLLALSLDLQLAANLRSRILDLL